jgi:peptide/nickel transport system permease protein
MSSGGAFSENRLALLGLLILLALLFVAAFADDRSAQSAAGRRCETARPAAAGRRAIFGTDDQGRDILRAVIVYGTRLTLLWSCWSRSSRHLSD